MIKKQKENITEKCERLEKELNKLKRFNYNSEEKRSKLEKQIISLKKKNIALENKVLELNSKKGRKLEDIIEEYNYEQSGKKITC